MILEKCTKKKYSYLCEGVNEGKILAESRRTHSVFQAENNLSKGSENAEVKRQERAYHIHKIKKLPIQDLRIKPVGVLSTLLFPPLSLFLLPFLSYSHPLVTLGLLFYSLSQLPLLFRAAIDDVHHHHPYHQHYQIQICLLDFHNQNSQEFIEKKHFWTRLSFQEGGLFTLLIW